MRKKRREKRKLIRERISNRSKIQIDRVPQVKYTQVKIWGRAKLAFLKSPVSIVWYPHTKNASVPHVLSKSIDFHN